MKKRILCLLLAFVMIISMAPVSFAAEETEQPEVIVPEGGEIEGGEVEGGEVEGGEVECDDALPTERACEHTYKYALCEDSVAATDDEGGYRHYQCSECGAEYAYYTDPMVYADGFVKQDGSVVEVNETNAGATNPYLPLWEHIADAEPHVFWSREDLEWRLYVYGSHDTTGVICGNDYVTWSAPVYDLSDWRYEGETLRVGYEYPEDEETEEDEEEDELIVHGFE